MEKSTFIASINEGRGIQEVATVNYRRLLALGDAASEPERHHLRMAAHALEKTLEQMHDDHATVAMGIHLQAQVARLPSVEIDIQTAEINLRQVQAENVRLAAERDAILKSAQDRLSIAQATATELRDHGRELAGLKDRRPDLFDK